MKVNPVKMKDLWSIDNGINCPNDIDCVDSFKKSDCTNYRTCLKIASDAGWSQFHCNDCSAYVKDEFVKWDILRYLVYRRKNASVYPDMT